MNPELERWKLTLEYDGRGFSGWAAQPGQRSVQAEVERAASILVQHPVTIDVSGRTDAGVHALGQVAAFSTRSRREPAGVRSGMNAHLPDDVAVVEAERVDPSFDPRRDTRVKHYRYTWLDRPARSPWLHDRVWHRRGRLDVARMDEAARLLDGTWDFASFRAIGCSAATTVRTIPSWRVTRDGDLVCLDVMGHGFLRHMIRIVAGSLLLVGEGRRPPSWLAEARDAKRREAAGDTAPPGGLVLVSVTYGPPPLKGQGEGR